MQDQENIIGLAREEAKDIVDSAQTRANQLLEESDFVYRGALEDKRDRMGGPRTGPRGGRGFDAQPRRPFDDKPRRAESS